MYTGFKQDEYEDEEMTLESGSFSPDAHNTGQVNNNNDEVEAAKKKLEYYYDAKIYRNHPNLLTIREKYKE